METKKNFYFFKTIEEKGEIRVVALDKQKGDDGKDVISTAKVSCSRSIRSMYEIGTVFVGDSLKYCKKGCYTTTRFRKLTASMSAECAKYKTVYGIDFISKKESLFEKISADPKFKCPTPNEDGFYMKDMDWKLLIRNIQKHVNTLILGPTGCGKTSCIQLICDRIGVPLEIFDMSTIIDPISSLLGVHRISEGRSIFDFAKFTQAIQRPGVILLDELNRSSLSSGNVILSCLDQRRTLYVEIAGSKDIREIKVHPEVTFIATANVGSEYTGANSAMDRALLNRFFPLELGNIPSAEESSVLMKRTKIEKSDSDLIVKVANNIRSLYNKQEISLSLSIRETLMVADLVSDGWSLGNAMEMIYLPLYEGTKTEGERSTIFKTISSY
jgi:nitric oxide reductase NorQ protein